MIFIGIDPGLTGAVAFVDHRSCVVEDLPTMPLPGAGLVQRKIDGRAFVELLRRHTVPGEKVRVFVEQVGTMGGKNNAVQTQGSLMRTLGAIEAVLECMRMAPVMVSPQTWKQSYGLINPKWKDAERKKCSVQKARDLYPSLAGTSLRLAASHNRAEAILIAHWGQLEHA